MSKTDSLTTGTTQSSTISDSNQTWKPAIFQISLVSLSVDTDTAAHKRRMLCTYLACVHNL